MATIKSVNRSASVAISPDSPYMAAGTMAGAVDLSFSSSSNLEIFNLDLSSPHDLDLPLIGGSPSSERFNRLSWSKSSPGSQNFPLGLLAGGLVDGNIHLWNPNAVISSDASENAVVGHLSKHKGPVRGLEFNYILPNLLASGADEGEICIWDLTSPTVPSHFPPLKGTGSAAQGEISFLSWNSKVQQHILASTSYNGTTVVWDLRKQKPVISFSDSVRRRCSVLQWNPDLATQLIVASDEDDSPSLKLWDMRNTLTPVKEFVGHTKGVIAMSWCPSDSAYLLTCAKDNRTICWDTVSGEIVCELPAGTNWNFDVHWYPRIPGVITASSFDGKIGIYNIEGCSRYGVGDNQFGAAPPLRAPKWYKRPVGVSFGFGGKLVSFHLKSLPTTGSSTGGSEVYVHNLVTEHSLASRSSEFEASVQNGERSSLRVLCDKKSNESESENDRQTWGFLKVMFEDEGTARTKLLTHLGFTIPTEEKNSVQDLSQQANSLDVEEKVADKNTVTSLYDNGEDFFNSLPSPKADTPVFASGDKFVDESFVHSVQQELYEVDESSDTSFDDVIQRALVVGDYKGAVSECISSNKMAEALVIAHAGGASLWESTRDQYLKLNCPPYLKIVSAMVNNDLISLVNTRPLKSWKETLALLCTFARGEEWALLCDTLAARLIFVGNTLAATLCYICAGNIDKTVGIWSQSLSVGSEGNSYVDLLQDLMEKTIVLALATEQKRFSASLYKLVEKYAEILISQGLLTTAMEYLKLLGSDELSPELLILRNHIAISTEPDPKTAAFEFSQPQTGSVYGSDQFGLVGTSQQYYQEPAPSQIQQSIPGSPYGEQYQQPFSSSYGRGYGAPPVQYQSTSQPHIFMPSSTPQTSQPSFVPPNVPNQPAARPFVPATPPTLRNVEQYQQPTLASQLYPGTNAPYHPTGIPLLAPSPSPVSGPVNVPKMPQVVGPTSIPRGFMPINNPGVQQPVIQPPSPSHQVSAQPLATPAAPPPKVQTVDTSNVPAQQRPVVITLTKLFNETSEALGGSRSNPAKKREIDDNSRKIGALFAKLNSGDISKNAADKLIQLCQALDSIDYITALQIQVQLTTSEWDECNLWLSTLKRMIKTRQSVRL